MADWSTACPDWEARIQAGGTLVPDLPLFEAEAARAERIFNRLRIPDVIGKPTMAESGTEWLLPIVRAIFGSYDPETNRRMIQEFFWLVPKKNSKSSGAAAIMVTVLIVNRRPLAEALLVAPTKEIANIAYKQAWGIIQADAELAKLFHGQHHVRTINNAKYRRLQSKLIDAVPRAKRQGGRMDPDEQDRITATCLRETVLLDWRGLEGEDGQPMLYSKDLAGDLLSKPEFRRFREGVIWAAAQVGEERAAADEADAGNSQAA